MSVICQNVKPRLEWGTYSGGGCETVANKLFLLIWELPFCYPGRGIMVVM